MTPIILGVFFLVAALVCLAAGTSVLAPGSPLDAMWTIKPAEHRQLLAMAPWSGLGFIGLAAVMAIASFGTFARKRWGWRLALAIFAANGLGDAAQLVAGRVVEGAVGVAVVLVVLYALTRRRIKAIFAR